MAGKTNRRRRRDFLQTAGLAAVTLSGARAAAGAESPRNVDAAALDRAAARPILKTDAFKDPVKIASVELLRGKGGFFVRTRSADGAVGVAVTNSRAAYLYPIFEKLVAPYFVGKDARRLEELVDGVYRWRSNYKLSGLALWCCVAWTEFSVLDLLGRLASKPVGELLGGVVRREVAFYHASGRRDTTPRQEAALLAKEVARLGAKAVKFKVGGRMSNNADSLPGRTEGLIPLVRKTLGDKITLHADANGSYDARKGIEVGRRLQDQGVYFFEEPCPFDHLEATKAVADALEIRIAGGEQESSPRRFRWMIQNAAVQVVQPDLHYYGGMIRSARVARMAAAAGLEITVHMSGDGVGFVDMLHFASRTPNMGPFQEYKGSVEKVGLWYDPPLRRKDGKIAVPTGPGLGLPLDADVFRQGKPIGR